MSNRVVRGLWYRQINFRGSPLLLLTVCLEHVVPRPISSNLAVDLDASICDRIQDLPWRASLWFRGSGW